jgi:hypothetical protein
VTRREVEKFLTNWNYGTQMLTEGNVDKKVGLPLGTGAPEGALRGRCRFHTGVGSSILASLSEAGGNDLQK